MFYKLVFNLCRILDRDGLMLVLLLGNIIVWFVFFCILVIKYVFRLKLRRLKRCEVCCFRKCDVFSFIKFDVFELILGDVWVFDVDFLFEDVLLLGIILGNECVLRFELRSFW